MNSVSGKISLEMFGGSAGHDFFKEIIQFELHCSLRITDVRESTKSS
jgi:hypothetical protein